MNTFHIPIIVRNRTFPIWAKVRAYSQSDAILKALEKYEEELDGKDFRIVGDEIVVEEN